MGRVTMHLRRFIGSEFDWSRDPSSTEAPEEWVSLRSTHPTLAPTIREIMTMLEQAGFVDRGGKGIHLHPRVTKPITVSGKHGDDAQRYVVKAVQKAIDESQQ